MPAAILAPNAIALCVRESILASILAPRFTASTAIFMASLAVSLHPVVRSQERDPKQVLLVMLGHREATGEGHYATTATRIPGHSLCRTTVRFPLGTLPDAPLPTLNCRLSARGW
jgi:hypothetical protein